MFHTFKVDPVAQNIPTYFDVIKYPMDLLTLKTKLSNGDFCNIHEFAETCRLIFTNAMTFNPPISQVHQDAITLLKYFERELGNILSFSNESQVLPKHNVDGISHKTQSHVHSPSDLPPLKKLKLKADETPSPFINTPLTGLSTPTPTAPLLVQSSHKPSPKILIKPPLNASTSNNNFKAISAQTNISQSAQPNIVPTLSSVMKGSDKKKCQKILNKLVSDGHAKVFLAPVDPIALGIPQYFEIIKHPMDLGTINNKLENNLYTNPDDFKNDIALMLTNCFTFNRPGMMTFTNFDSR